MPGECPAGLGEGIDVRTLNIIDSKGVELRPEVIDADEEDVGSPESGGEGE
jgi:hypothetical protein